MKKEDLYEAVTELRDDQIAEGEKQLSSSRPARFRRLGALAAILAVVVLAGVLAGPKLMAGIGGKPVGKPVESGTTQAGPTGADPSGAEAPTEDPDQQEALNRKYSLAYASYPHMAPYANMRNYLKADGTLDFDAYRTAMSAWEESRGALRPETDYTEGMDAYLRAALPELLSGGEGENGVCSPLNVYMALAMLAETTAGESRQELLTLLNAPDLETLRARANALWLANYCDDGRLTSLLAASLWLRDDTGYKDDTVQTLSKDHFASVFSGPMGDPEYNGALRRWMNFQTHGLLADQIEDVELSADTVAALVTTVYYQAAWEEAFYLPAGQSFYGPAGETSCLFMRQSRENTLYEGESFRAAGVELTGSGSMYFLLPEEGLTPEALLTRADALDFLLGPETRGNTDGRRVQLTLTVPEFDVSAETDLIARLKALGVTAIFDEDRSDFSPLTTEVGPITVTRADHAARVSADEKGVTGAAYTVIDATKAAEPEELEEVELTLDRPFLFLVTNEEGLPLFVGVVNAPTP